MRFIQQNFKFV